MQISLRVRLDTARDRFVIELEDRPEVPTYKPIAVEGMKEPIELVLNGDGYVAAIEIPNLKAGLAVIAGIEKPTELGKPGKPGKPGK